MIRNFLIAAALVCTTLTIGCAPAAPSQEAAERGPKWTVRYEMPGGAVRTVNLNSVNCSQGTTWFVDPETGKMVILTGTRTEIVQNW